MKRKKEEDPEITRERLKAAGLLPYNPPYRNPWTSPSVWDELCGYHSPDPLMRNL